MTAPIGSADLGITCLIIEDDADSASLLEAILRSWAIKTHTVPSAESARSFLEADQPDIIICDLKLPNEDGLSFVRWLRARPTDDASRIPAIAVTARYEDFTSRQARDAGFDLYLTKPLDLDSLPHYVVMLVARRRNPR